MSALSTLIPDPSNASPPLTMSDIGVRLRRLEERVVDGMEEEEEVMDSEILIGVIIPELCFPVVDCFVDTGFIGVLRELEEEEEEDSTVSICGYGG